MPTDCRTRVDSNGKVTAVDLGTTIVTAKTENGNGGYCVASCEVTVIPDKTRPTILSVSPKKNQKNVSITGGITVYRGDNRKIQ